LAANARNERHLYVYAIVPAEAPVGAELRGVEGELLSLVRYGTLAAVVGEVSRERWERTAEHLLAHEAAGEAIRAAGEALPVRFGTVMRGEGAVAETLSRQASALHGDLARLGAMMEFDLALLVSSSALRDVAGERAEPLAAARNIRGSGAGARYLRGRMRAHSKAQLFEARLLAARGVIDESLARYAREVRWTDVATERIASIAAYLVDQSSVPALRQAFAVLRGERPEFDVVLKGPSAPYSFVTSTDDRARAGGVFS
jgi:hypothetical protein